MTKTIQFLSLAISLFSISLSAQSTQVQIPTEVFRNELRDGSGLPESVQGTPYENENFTIGTIQIKDEQFPNSLLRYNVYKDEIEVKKSETNISILLKRAYVKAVIAEKQYVIMNFMKNDEKKQGYFKVLNDGGIKLLLRQTKKFYKAEEDLASTYRKAKPARLKDENQYYLLLAEDRLEEVKLNKKSILKALDNELANSLAKEKRLKLKDEAGVIKLLKQL